MQANIYGSISREHNWIFMLQAMIFIGEINVVLIILTSDNNFKKLSISTPFYVIQHANQSHVSWIVLKLYRFLYDVTNDT